MDGKKNLMNLQDMDEENLKNEKLKKQQAEGLKEEVKKEGKKEENNDDKKEDKKEEELN